MKGNIGAAGVMAAVGTAASLLGGIFTPLFFVLVAFEVMDYVTGMYAGWKNGGWTSQKAFEGAVKKLFYFFLVAVGVGFDYLITDAMGRASLGIQYPAVFGTLTVWFLLSTEFISILENLSEVGVEVPFLMAALKVFRERLDRLGRDKSGNVSNTGRAGE